ncbi:hypothetical protein H4S00_004671, partial [Coemansia sp. D1744]
RNSTPTGVPKNKLTSDNTKQGSRPSTPPGDSSITNEMGIPIPSTTRKRQATSPAKESSKLVGRASAAEQQISQLQERVTVLEEELTHERTVVFTMFLSIMDTLRGYEEDEAVDEILARISTVDDDSSGLSSTLRKWHAQSLKERESSKAVPSPTHPTKEAPQGVDTQSSPSTQPAGPVAPAAVPPALPQEPEDVEMAVDSTAKSSFAAVVAKPSSPQKSLASPGRQRTSVRQTDPPAAASSSPLRLHQVWIKGLVPERISSLKKKLFNEHFILREIHDITFFPRRVTRFTVSGKYYHRFLRQCEAMMWVRQEGPGRLARFTDHRPALPAAAHQSQEKSVATESERCGLPPEGTDNRVEVRTV